jgi:rhamnosyltransferase subunit B
MANEGSKRVFLVGIGTHGDVLPVIALGAALQARGAEVRLAAPAPFRQHADRAGLTFHPIGTPADFARAVAQPNLWRPIRGARAMLAAVVEAVEPTYRWLEAEATPADRVVASTLAFGARVAQERLGLSLTTLHLMPMLLESRFAPPRLPGLPLPRLLPARWRHNLGRGADRFVLGPAALPPLNAFRARLGLAPIKRLRHWWHSPERILLAVPDWYASPQPDWPAQVIQTGFPLSDTYGDSASLPPDLNAFLRAGSPPLVFTYGSAMAGAQGFFATAVQVCRLSGRRGILLAGRNDEIPADLPPDVIHVPYAPLSRLLPSCAVLIHHGGVGTVAQALAAGCPQLIVPVAFDHADEAERVVRLGVGNSLTRWRFTAGRARQAIEGLLHSPTVAVACRKVQELMRSESGVEEACEFINGTTLRPSELLDRLIHSYSAKTNNKSDGHSHNIQIGMEHSRSVIASSANIWKHDNSGDRAMTGGGAFRHKLLNDYVLRGPIEMYLANPSDPSIIDVGKGHIDVRTAVLAHPDTLELLARADATPGQRKNAVRAAVLLAPIGADQEEAEVMAEGCR